MTGVRKTHSDLAPSLRRPRSAVRTAGIGLTLLLLVQALAILSCRKYPEIHVNPEDYTHIVDNQYFPLTQGTIKTYSRIWNDDTTQYTFEVTDRTEEVLGVLCCMAKDSGDAGVDRYDVTHRWYAQDKNGDVWRFGGRTIHYRFGQPVSEESWKAGEYGVEPKFIISSDPQVGDVSYWQGTSRTIVSTDERAVVPYGEFSNCLLVREWGGGEFSYCAPGIGIVLMEDTLHSRNRTELVSITGP